jgi:hypothetical protein
MVPFINPINRRYLSFVPYLLCRAADADDARNLK